MKKMLPLMAIFIAIFAFSCASTVMEGRKVDSSRTNQLVIGSTTPQNAMALFGQPLQVQNLPGGEQQMTYRYYYNNPHWWTADETERQDLVMVFRNGVLDRYDLKENVKEYLTMPAGSVR